MARAGWKRTYHIVPGCFSVAVTALCAQPAHADEWGCEVLLCMSNPAGPEAVGQCVPPMQRFYNVLKHGGSRPT